MMRFLLLAGSHAEGLGATRVVYGAGQVVESEVDLVKKCGADKFRRLAPGEEPAGASDGLDSRTHSELQSLADELGVRADQPKSELIRAIRVAQEGG